MLFIQKQDPVPFVFGVLRSFVGLWHSHNVLFRIFGSQVALRAYVLTFFCLGGGGLPAPTRGHWMHTPPFFDPRIGGSVHIVSFVFLAFTGSYALWIANCYWFCVQVTTTECHRRVLYGSWAVWAQAHWSDILQIRQCGPDSQALGLVEIVLHLRPPRRGLGPCWDCAAWMLLVF